MKTSIIVVTKDHKDFIINCCLSLFSQAKLLNPYKFEVIVFENSLNDDITKEIRDKLTKGNKYLDYSFRIISGNRTLSECCNEALKIAKGEYILRVDGDDVLDARHLAFTTPILDNHETIDFVLTDHEFIGERKGVRRINRNDISTWLACGNLYRRGILEDIGGWNDLIYEEIDLHLRLMIKGRRQFHLPLPLYNYRIHKDQMTKNKELMRIGEQQLKNIYSENVLNSYGVIFK